VISVIVLALSITLLAIQYMWDGGKLSPFNAKNLFQVYFIIQLPLVLFIGTHFDVYGFVELNEQYDQRKIAVLGASIIAGQCALITGYYSIGSLHPRLMVTNYRWHRKRVQVAGALLFAVGYLAFYLLMEINGGYQQFVTDIESWRAVGLQGQGWLLFPATSLLGIAASSLVLVNRKLFATNGGLLILAALCLLTVAPASQLGFRGPMLLPVLQIMAAYHWGVREVSIRKFAPSILLLAVIFTVYGIYREGRNYLATTATASDYFAFAMEKPELIFGIILRSRGADVLAVVHESINKSGEFRYILPSVIETLTILIPRSVWAGKPIPQGVIFSEQFFGISGGVSPTIVGEGYWNLGIPGVILYLLVFGALLGVLNKIVRENPRNSTIILLACCSFPSLIMCAESVQGHINGLFMIVTICAALSFVYSISLKSHVGNDSGSS